MTEDEDLPLTTPNLETMVGQLGESKDCFALERFIDAPLEEYPVDIMQVERAATQLMPEGETTCGYDGALYVEPRFTRPEPYPRRWSYAQSRASSQGSASDGSVHSFGSCDSRGSRRGRCVLTKLAKPDRPPLIETPFFCTFCGRSFRGRYEWNRHEESVHVPRQLWPCNLSAIEVYAQASPWEPCDCCGELIRSLDHLDIHKISTCEQRPDFERVFRRKDHLIQHLEHYHSCTKGSQALCRTGAVEAGPIQTSHPALHCGFCGSHASDWVERVNHIALHFNSKVDICEWWLSRKSHSPDHGLEIECDCEPDNKRCSYQQSIEGPGNCFYWSCRFLPSEKNCYVLSYRWLNIERWICQLCPKTLLVNTDDEQDLSRRDRIDHLKSEHRYRQCSQELFSCASQFLRHLYSEHSLENGILCKMELDKILAPYRAPYWGKIGHH